MIIRSVRDRRKLDHLEVIEKYAGGDWDMNIEDVGIIVQDINTGKKYDPQYPCYFEHGIDEYFIDEKNMKEVTDETI